MDIRKRIFEIIEVDQDGDYASKVYDVFMMAMIIISIIPLTMKPIGLVGNLVRKVTLTMWIDKVTVVIFIIDYLLRIATADYKLNKGKRSFFLYPFSFMAVIDLISILPSLLMINRGLRLFRIFRLFRTFRVFRVFRAFRYSKNLELIVNVFRKQKDSLTVVFGCALGYILVSALIVFNVEPQTFDSFFDAVYWATISLTTVGYGDIYPVSTIGRMITMISSLLGITIVALPASIITAGYVDELRSGHEEKE